MMTVQGAGADKGRRGRGELDLAPRWRECPASAASATRLAVLRRAEQGGRLPQAPHSRTHAPQRRSRVPPTHTHTRAHAGHGSAKAAAAPTPAAERSAHAPRSAHARTAVQPGKGTRRCDVTGTNLSQNPLRPRLRASASVRKPLNYALSTEKLYRM